MIVTKMELSIRCRHANSLKEKRRIRQSLLSKLFHHYKISCMETEHHDIHNYLQIGVAFVSLSESEARKKVHKVLDFLEEEYDIEVLQVDWEMI